MGSVKGSDRVGRDNSLEGCLIKSSSPEPNIIGEAPHPRTGWLPRLTSKGSQLVLT
eukprot:CAMPEP_0204034988 /NCGR_PEP_ID=MMETSP0360-20130528/74577_1 /ASSEMBLY_ACC=CAM_ASM_000342 /TAXON_ID=268821 /ORGANISM="Scrippsiella Hangoei, Strain SHTV-5" /LENGTH=55 /DNA_ID=CAMNT_0050979907 /DNA_START=24 /DNA_END=187 /DNA_ORIENTATION=+